MSLKFQSRQIICKDFLITTILATVKCSTDQKGQVIGTILKKTFCWFFFLFFRSIRNDNWDIDRKFQRI